MGPAINWRGISVCNCSAVVICDQGMIWHGGQEDPTVEGIKLSGSRNAGGRANSLWVSEASGGDEVWNSHSIVL